MNLLALFLRKEKPDRFELAKVSRDHRLVDAAACTDILYFCRWGFFRLVFGASTSLAEPFEYAQSGWISECLKKLALVEKSFAHMHNYAYKKLAGQVLIVGRKPGIGTS